MDKHIAVLGFINLALGLMSLVGGVLVMVFGLGSGLVAFLGGGEDGAAAGGMLAVLGGGLAVVILIGAALTLLTGYGLLARKSWGRILGLLASALNLFSFPYLTLLGIYGFWVLLSKQSVREFQRSRQDA